MSYMDTVRMRKPTERGRLYNIELLHKQKSALENEVLLKHSLIEELMKVESNYRRVKDELKKLDLLFEDVLFIKEKFENLLQPDDSFNPEDWFSRLDNKTFYLKNNATRWLRSIHIDDDSYRLSRRSKSSKSSKASSMSEYKVINEEVATASSKSETSRRSSSKSSRSSKSSKASSVRSSKNKVIEEEAEIASLKAKVKFLEQKGFDQSDNLKLQEEIAMREAKIEVYKKYWVNESAPKANAANVSFNSSSQALVDILQMQGVPDVEVEVFEGDPLEYRFFITSFENVVESKVKDPKGRLARLLKFTKGEPNDLIKGCIYRDNDDCYDYAKTLLSDRFGDPHRILCAYRKELKEWKQIKHEDSSSFKKFYAFLMKCSCMVKGHYWNTLDSAENLCSIVLKLPNYSRSKWNKRAFSIRSKNCREPDLSDLLSFIHEEVTLACDPLFSREALNDKENFSQDKSEKGKGLKPIKTFTSKLVCHLCNKNHDLESCSNFTSKDLKEKTRLLMKMRLCFGCYGKGHISKDCLKRKSCNVCNGKHPTGLHGYVPKKVSEQSDVVADSVSQTTPVTNACVTEKGINLSNCAISMCIVPVLLRHENSTYDILTYALLDNCSQGTFIDRDLLSSLSVSTTKTEITIKTLTTQETESSDVVDGLSVKGVYSQNKDWIKLPKTYSRSNLPVNNDEIPTPEKLKQWSYLEEIIGDLSYQKEAKVGLLIGANCPKALEPCRIIPSKDGGPFAFLTKLGWCVVGPMASNDNVVIDCHRIQVNEHNFQQRFICKDQLSDNGIENMLQKLYEIDKVPSLPFLDNDIDVSQDDLKFLEIMKSGIVKVDGHYQLPLPFRDKDLKMPNNLSLAKKRLNSLKRRFARDTKFKSEYTSFIQGMVNKGFARKVTKHYDEGKSWFIPHHGVFHPTKQKIRVVFDCSATYENVSLNDVLLQGPDLTNQLLGVLIRFRQNYIAFMGDIEAMFYQVRVPEEQRSFLQFLWWENGNVENNFSYYEMCVHIFGGTSSPSCSNFALRQTAIDGKNKFDEEACKTLLRNFYVDDLLKSVSDSNLAINLVKAIIEMCQVGGFRLTKFVSNSNEVLGSIPEIDRRNIGNCELIPKGLSEQALGVNWHITNDTFGFRTSLKETQMTRRGLLSLISSVYDPLGIASPFLLQGKRILQDLCRLQLNWDDSLPDNYKSEWLMWKSEISGLKNLNVPRCFKPHDFGEIKEITLHHFADASDIGYGCCSYLRLIDSTGLVHCSLVLGKSRVAPLKGFSIPRLELLAATLVVKIARTIRNELEYNLDEEYYYTDSTIVLGYIKNKTKRFKLFVTNRVILINQLSKPDQWFHVDTKHNPADLASRGIKSSSDLCDVWFNGPKFLWEKSVSFPVSSEDFSVSDNDPECKQEKCKKTVAVVSISYFDIVSFFEERISDFDKMKRILAYVLLFVSKLKLKKPARKHTMNLRHSKCENIDLNVEDINNAFQSLLLLLQTKYFRKELKACADKVDAKSNLSPLKPFIDINGLLRVGGRLKNSNLDYNIKHPIIIPKSSPIALAIIRSFHNQVHHAGRGITMNEIRDNGLWIVNMNSLCKRVLRTCVNCLKLRGNVGSQIMGNLPVDRTIAAEPFSYVGLDLFGPFVIKERRSYLKRYGVMFTCLSCRAIHIETVNSLETDSFIMSLRRFISRRGNVREIRSDNGTNFVGAKNELKKEFENMDHSKISEFLERKNTDWIKWYNNPPYASHFGGVWERQIRTAREILNGILLTHGQSLKDESLRTLLCEVECIVNSRPLTVEFLNDPLSPKPLTPNTLLTHKTKVVLPPPGQFNSPYVFSRRHWKRVQHMANEFWQRWRKEFLQQLQPRTKWQKHKRNFQIGDIVLLKIEDAKRNEWPLAIVTNVQKDALEDVRSVTLRTTKRESIERPVSKIVLLHIGDSPPKEPTE